MVNNFKTRGIIMKGILIKDLSIMDCDLDKPILLFSGTAKELGEILKKRKQEFENGERCACCGASKEFLEYDTYKEQTGTFGNFGYIEKFTKGYKCLSCGFEEVW